MKIYLAFFAVIAMLTAACVSDVNKAGAADTKGPNFTSDLRMLSGGVVHLNGFTYNCIIVSSYSGGVWCEKLTGADAQ